jgi:hypothetical protein
MTPPQSATILDILSSDLTGIAALATRLASTTDRFDTDVETAQLVREIVQHHVAVEQQLNPLIAVNIDDGEKIAHGQFVEHRALESELRGLEGLEPGSAAFIAKLSAVRDRWQANAEYLRSEVFPALQASVDPAELVTAGEAVLGAEQTGPTRPRVLAVEQPAANVALSIAQGFVDKTIDAFSHRGHEGGSEIDERLREGRYDRLEED